jgi:hypothetical protein
MSNELHELSTSDLEEVSGGIYRNFTPGGPSITPSIPIPPPVLGPLGSGPVIPGGYPIGTITPQ